MGTTASAPSDSTPRATFFDGVSSARRTAELRLGDRLVISDEDGEILAAWPWEAIRRVSGGARDVLRLTAAGGAELARLEVRDPETVNAILVRTGGFAAHDAADRRTHVRIVAWCLAAVVSLSLVGVYGVPLIADRLTPLLPWSVDEKLGAAFDGQIRFLLTDEREDDCGTRQGEEDGARALAKLTGALESRADLPFDLKVAVIRNDVVNAFATPGGYIYVLSELIDDAGTPEELAGVLAHEIGHAAARDGTRRLIQSSGVSFLFGSVFGDFAGGTAVVIGSQMLLESAYSREAETRADAFALDLMRRAEIDPAGLAAFFRRMSKEEGEDAGAFSIISSHPVTGERIRAIESASASTPNRPILSPEEWADVKAICGGEE
jgi:Zn-dependent protease with chaperone function